MKYDSDPYGRNLAAIPHEGSSREACLSVEELVRGSQRSLWAGPMVSLVSETETAAPLGLRCGRAGLGDGHDQDVV